MLILMLTFGLFPSDMRTEKVRKLNLVIFIAQGRYISCEISIMFSFEIHACSPLISSI